MNKFFRALLATAFMSVVGYGIYQFSENERPTFVLDESEWSSTQREYAEHTLAERRALVSGMTVFTSQNGETVYRLADGTLMAKYPTWLTSDDRVSLTDFDRESIARTVPVSAPSWIFWTDEISLQEYDQLITSLLLGLVFGVLASLISDLMLGLIIGLAGSLTQGLLAGLTAGLVLGLTFILVYIAVHIILFIGRKPKKWPDEESSVPV